jgi:hypothetical protein
VQCLLSTNTTSGHIFCCQVIARRPCECPDVGTMFQSQPNLFPVQNLPLVFHYHFFTLWRLCTPHAGYKQESFQLQRWSPLALSSCRNCNLHHIHFTKNYKILLRLRHLVFSWGVCW